MSSQHFITSCPKCLSVDTGKFSVDLHVHSWRKRKTRKVIASMRLSKNVAEQTTYRDLLSKIFLHMWRQELKFQNKNVSFF